MKVALVTQSYKNDFRECQLLCESIDRFAPDNIMHFIFVNDEDYQMFKNIENKKHKVYKKGTIMPWYFIRIPWKMMGHHFHISLFSIPVREWILQQICKFGVFNVIGKEYDAVFNVDSECVFMRPFSIDELMKEGKFYMYKNEKITQPSHDDYYEAARKLFNNQQIGGGVLRMTI